MSIMVEPKSGKSKQGDTALPLSRIRTIMKSSVDTGNISNEVLFVVEKSAEMFIQHMAKSAYKKCKQGNMLKYEQLSAFVSEDDSLEFLLQIVPQKITVKEFKEIIADDGETDETSSDSEEEPPEQVKKKTNKK